MAGSGLGRLGGVVGGQGRPGRALGRARGAATAWGARLPYKETLPRRRRAGGHVLTDRARGAGGAALSALRQVATPSYYPVTTGAPRCVQKIKLSRMEAEQVSCAARGSEARDAPLTPVREPRAGSHAAGATSAASTPCTASFASTTVDSQGNDCHHNDRHARLLAGRGAATIWAEPHDDATLPSSPGAFGAFSLAPQQAEAGRWLHTERLQLATQTAAAAARAAPAQQPPAARGAAAGVHATPTAPGLSMATVRALHARAARRVHALRAPRACAAFTSSARYPLLFSPLLSPLLSSLLTSMLFAISRAAAQAQSPRAARGSQAESPPPGPTDDAASPQQRSEARQRL